jgi:hypothetical protein
VNEAYRLNNIYNDVEDTDGDFAISEFPTVRENNQDLDLAEE